MSSVLCVVVDCYVKTEKSKSMRNSWRMLRTKISKIVKMNKWKIQRNCYAVFFAQEINENYWCCARNGEKR